MLFMLFFLKGLSVLYLIIAFSYALTSRIIWTTRAPSIGTLGAQLLYKINTCMYSLDVFQRVFKKYISRSDSLFNIVKQMTTNYARKVAIPLLHMRAVEVSRSRGSGQSLAYFLLDLVT